MSVICGKLLKATSLGNDKYLFKEFLSIGWSPLSVSLRVPFLKVIECIFNYYKVLGSKSFPKQY